MVPSTLHASMRDNFSEVEWYRWRFWEVVRLITIVSKRKGVRITLATVRRTNWSLDSHPPPLSNENQRTIWSTRCCEASPCKRITSSLHIHRGYHQSCPNGRSGLLITMPSKLDQGLAGERRQGEEEQSKILRMHTIQPLTVVGVVGTIERQAQEGTWNEHWVRQLTLGSKSSQPCRVSCRSVHPPSKSISNELAIDTCQATGILDTTMPLRNPLSC